MSNYREYLGQGGANCHTAFSQTWNTNKVEDLPRMVDDMHNGKAKKRRVVVFYE